jgi:uncharacterized peroxidase-related enzyme
MRDYTTAPLDPRDRAMLDFAVALTRAPAEVRRADVDRLRAAGFDDVAIHDLVHVTALFNYFVRVADGLGIEDEPDWAERGWDWD